MVRARVFLTVSMKALTETRFVVSVSIRGIFFAQQEAFAGSCALPALHRSKFSVNGPGVSGHSLGGVEGRG